MDVSDFYDTFFEEAGELLEDMERLLIELDTDAPDRDHLDAIFRAAHSIKGGAGTFGFEALQDTTHRMENLLDRARNGELTLDRAAVDILLEAGDVLKGQVESYREGQSPDAEAADRICRVLQQLAEGASPSPISAEPGTGAPADSAQVDTGERCLSIRVTGIGAGDADALAEELALFGAVTDRRDEAEALTLELTTSAATADISAVLCFIVDEDQIRIEPAGPAQAAGDGARLRVILDGVTPEDRPGLVEEVGLFGEIVAQHADGERLSLDLVSDQPAEDIAAVLAFQLDANQIHVESLTADAPAAAESKPEASPGEGPSTDKTDQTAAGVSPSKPTPSKPAPAAQAASGERPRERSGSESTSVRVPTDKIDQIINLVGELVITQSMLERAVGELDREHGEGLSEGMGQLARNARDLQESVMSVRMVPMDFAFNRFPRLVRDLSAKLGKDVNLETRGGATELDKGLIERIMDPMTHLVRNSLDHGIEDAATREAAGKPAAGQLTLSARHQGGNVVIEIGDDGAGLSRERILAKARSNGLAVSDDMPDEEVWQLIFAAGFSTAEQVSDVSGRGVGMDVVKRNIAQLGGHVDLRSQQGVGTTVRVILPLTLAIMDGMAVRVGDEVFILALGAILESMRIDESAVRTVTAGHHVIEVRGEYLPLVALHRAFDVEGAQTRLDRGIVVVVSSESRRFGLFVDELIGEQQVVVKNLETHFRKVAGISAATILGDGSVALILDATALSRMAGAPRPARSSSQSPADNNVPAESVSHE
ncbi:chemotaxis protein CheW [Salinisphaera sp. LB1]|uniref:chemotaxis protein CheW n=1 Tax=Salinisphaera sp. LB1 TaxID=2183911 RepID=UPI000D707081|nr:chemotaxis protein CheW [Salinisphaera sp. LB1]AWN16004.1 Signal transduction histidine kinase CheA [Salinisphaera sp. LB1]